MNDHYLKALNRIKAIVDAYTEKRIHLTIGNDDFDKESHTYDVSVVMGIIDTHINDAYRYEGYYTKGDDDL